MRNNNLFYFFCRIFKMMEPPEDYDFDPAEENFDDFMDDEEALVIHIFSLDSSGLLRQD